MIAGDSIRSSLSKVDAAMHLKRWYSNYKGSEIDQRPGSRAVKAQAELRALSVSQDELPVSSMHLQKLRSLYEAEVGGP